MQIIWQAIKGIFKVIAVILRGIMVLVVIGLFIGVGYMIWDSGRLEDVIGAVAENSVVGSSAFRLSLPADRLALISVEDVTAGSTCGSVMVKNGVIRNAMISEKDVAATLKFENGIDLASYADELSACDEISITLMAKAGFERATVKLGYLDGKVVTVGEPRIWD